MLLFWRNLLRYVVILIIVISLISLMPKDLKRKIVKTCYVGFP